MKIRDLAACCFLIVALSCGCSRGYEVGFQFDKTNAVDTWVLKSAPQVAIQALGTNAQACTIVLKNNGVAEYSMLPLQTKLDLTVVRSAPSQWRIVSGTNIWLFGNEQYGGKKVSKIIVETDYVGAGFEVGRLGAGDDVLIYKPDAESDDEPLIFRRFKKRK